MRSRTFLVAFLVGVAAITAFSIYLSLTTDRAVKSIAAAVSPDGRFKATRTRTSSSKICLDDVMVRFAVYPDALQEKRNLYEIYTVNCAPGDPLPEVEWLSARALKVTYSPPAKPPNLQARDITGAVEITFVARNR